MRLHNILSIIAPAGTPLGPAVMLGNELYQAMLSTGIAWGIALPCSIGAVAGIEATGALMCYNAIEAWRRGQWGKMGLAIIGAIGYGAAVSIGLATMEYERARVFALLVGITLFAYLAYALWESFSSADNASIKATTLEIERLREKKNVVNAQVRFAKAQGGVQKVSSASSGQTRQSITPLGQAIIDELKADGSRSLRDIAAKVVEKRGGTCSQQSVKTWKEYYERS